MKTPTQSEIIKELISLKELMKREDFQMGIGGTTEKKFYNKLNKIIRMEKCPMRKINLEKIFRKEKVKSIRERNRESSKKVRDVLNRLRMRNC